MDMETKIIYYLRYTMRGAGRVFEQEFTELSKADKEFDRLKNCGYSCIIEKVTYTRK